MLPQLMLPPDIHTFFVNNIVLLLCLCTDIIILATNNAGCNLQTSCGSMFQDPLVSPTNPSGLGLVCPTCHWNKYQLQHCKEQSLASHLQWTYCYIPLASPFTHHLYSHCVVLGHILKEVSIYDSWMHNTTVGSLLVDSQDLQI